MKLQTTIAIPPSPWKIGYDNRILLLGSCFSDEIGRKMEEYNLPVTCNPFGTLYNPLSIAQAVLMTEVPPLVEYDGLWHSMAHHGAFSYASEQQTHEAVWQSVLTMQTALHEADTVVVTFGTAWVYEMNGVVVGNCHKLPADSFTRRRLTADEIVAAWRPIILRYPDKHWLFTISPIRHLKDGLHENQLSKATLLLAVEQMNCNLPCSYFPSYEILLDELRDYRFYADDMMHPSALAVAYVWERFVETFCTPVTCARMAKEHKQWLFARHRPLHPDRT